MKPFKSRMAFMMQQELSVHHCPHTPHRIGKAICGTAGTWGHGNVCICECCRGRGEEKAGSASHSYTAKRASLLSRLLTCAERHREAFLATAHTAVFNTLSWYKRGHESNHGPVWGPRCEYHTAPAAMSPARMNFHQFPVITEADLTPSPRDSLQKYLLK